MSEVARTGETRPVSTPLGVRLGSATRDRIERFLTSFETFSPTLGLLYGYPAGNPALPGSWSMVAFGPETVADLDTSYAAFGASARFDLDGIEVLIPQLGHVAKLRRGEFYFDGGRLVVGPPEAQR